MAHITAQNELATTFEVEFDGKLYFRVEILRVETNQAIQSTTYLAKVYQLCWPVGVMDLTHDKAGQRFRQSWLFLQEFPPVSAVTVEAVRAGVMQKLPSVADSYLQA